jgi:hypothetical protein
MTTQQKQAAASEIRNMFVGFYVDNFQKFSNRLPEFIVNGEPRNYLSSLPEHISSQLQSENREQV